MWGIIKIKNIFGFGHNRVLKELCDQQIIDFAKVCIIVLHVIVAEKSIVGVGINGDY
jgi:hypothetical protein